MHELLIKVFAPRHGFTTLLLHNALNLLCIRYLIKIYWESVTQHTFFFWQVCLFEKAVHSSIDILESGFILLKYDILIQIILFFVK